MKRIMLCLLLLPLLNSCGTHFITDEVYRSIVKKDFENKRQLLADAPQDLFAVFKTSISCEEKEALQFLYAYSPLVDITMYGGEFMLANVRQSLYVREEMPWGEDIPEDIFRHFVLPLRSSNESLDSSRFTFYKELKDRVLKCSDMEEAALEVNHWCHEKAIYATTNARTCSPETMTKTAFGRCGEESVFAIAAMRSVGIPARQVYTPRWAHCDDNHAWIEVWVNGTWKYLGACEPEPQLNVAWFSVPVSRGLFMQARVFGRYLSDEEIVSVNPNGTNINVTGNYTDVKKTTVRILDAAGHPVGGAKVEYKIYNYGEYYPAVVFTTDRTGLVSLTVGEGDWVIWASKEGRYGFAKLDVRTLGEEPLDVVLNRGIAADYLRNAELVPPVAKEYKSPVTEPQRAVNDRRFAYEDSLRNAYVATFPDSLAISRMAVGYGVDSLSFNRIVKASRGNYPEIYSYFQKGKEQALSQPQMNLLADILGMLPEKDLQDLKAAELFSWVLPAVTAGYTGEAALRPYVLNPRVGLEPALCGRDEVTTFLTAKKVPWGANIEPAETIESLLDVMKQIIIVDSVNTVNIPTPPVGVIRAMVTDNRSRNILFVAACRIMSIPARLNPLDGKPEYYNTKWTTVNFTTEPLQPKGRLMLTYAGETIKDPVYFLNFTIARLEKGIAYTVDLGSNDQVDMGAGANYSSIFARPVELEAGDYVLVTGNRRADGSVMSCIASFTVKEGLLTTEAMLIPDINEKVEILGHIRVDIPFVSEGRNTARVPDIPLDGYTVLALIEPNKEPTNHLMRDMVKLKGKFEEWGIPMTFLFVNKGQYERFSRTDFGTMPTNLMLGYDEDRKVADMLAEDLRLKSVDNLPLVVVVNSRGEVVFLSQGYRIGLGEQLLKVISH